MQNFIEYVAVSTYKKILDYWLCPPWKENLLGSAHAQRRYNAFPTSEVQHGRFE